MDKSNPPKEIMIIKLPKLPCISAAFYCKGLDTNDDSKSENECGLYVE